MPGERGFSYLLSKDPDKTENLSLGDDTKMPAGDAFKKQGKHAAAKSMLASLKSGDHEGFSSALDDWHSLNEVAGPDASFDPENTSLTE